MPSGTPAPIITGLGTGPHRIVSPRLRLGGFGTRSFTLHVIYYHHYLYFQPILQFYSQINHFNNKSSTRPSRRKRFFRNKRRRVLVFPDPRLIPLPFGKFRILLAPPGSKWFTSRYIIWPKGLCNTTSWGRFRHGQRPGGEGAAHEIPPYRRLLSIKRHRSARSALRLGTG